MSKEEKIQEAYGDDFDRIKLFVNENGWVDTQTFSCARKGIEFEQYKKRSNTYLGFYNRPKTLNGIENNNGWTKIEGFEYLPKTGGIMLECISLSNGKQCTHHFLLGDEGYMIRCYSHYKLMPFNPPIY